MLFVKIGKIGKEAKEELECLRKFVTLVNSYIVKNWGDEAGVVNTGNLDFCLWKSLSVARKEIHRPNFHKVWASHTICEIAQKHPFVDGNKRTSYTIAKFILYLGNLDFEEDYERTKDYLIKIAIKKIPYDEVYFMD